MQKEFKQAFGRFARIREQTVHPDMTCWRWCSSRWRPCCAERSRARIWRTESEGRPVRLSAPGARRSQPRYVQPGVPSRLRGASLPERAFPPLHGSVCQEANGLKLTGVVAVDGKAPCATPTNAAAGLRRCIWSTSLRWMPHGFGPAKAAGRNETAGALEVLAAVMEGCTVTADARCIADNAAAVLKRGGDYVLAIRPTVGLFTAVCATVCAIG